MATYSNTAREVEMPNGDVVVIHNAPTGGENTASNIKKFKYDDNGHVTESTAADAEDLNLSSYSTPTTGTTAIGASDDLQTAIGKLDHQSHIDQTNILYGLNTGVKNWFVTPNGNYSSAAGGAESTWEFTDGACKVVTCTTNDTRAAFDIAEIKLPAGDYVMTGRHSGSCDVRLFKNGTNITPNDVSRFTLAAESVVTVAAYTYGTGCVGTVLKPLLCTEEAYAQSTAYQPPALPNYDLTRLESEDRASLAEVVDSGAKNKFQITQASTTGYTVNSDGTVTASGALSNSEFNMGNFLTGTLSNLVLSGCSGGSDNTYCLLFQYRISGGNVQAIRQYDDPVVINLTNVTWSALYVEVKSLSAGQTKVFKPMICTKAAFGVSNKFVPYRPNWDLVVDTLDRKLNAKTELGSIDMNDVIINCRGTASITANAPVTGYCFVDVIAVGYDVKQQIQKLSSPSTYYIRHRRYQATSPYYLWTSWFKYEGTEVTS